ncbi:MAG: alpha/beta hydrolase [Deltaproteobacteria bacterium]|nr:alpha/beta hydrolase [Deltaproteobacteria bacterium]
MAAREARHEQENASPAEAAAGRTVRAIDRERPFWRQEAWVLVAAGLLWLAWGAGAGTLPLLCSAPAGLLLTASGVSNLLWPGDPRERHFGALGALAGLVTTPLAILWLGLGGAAVLGALSFASAWAVGHLGLRLLEPWEDVPQPPHTLRTSLEVAVDSAVLSQMTLTAPARALRGSSERVAAEVRAALALFAERGWVADPASYHREPPALEKPALERSRARGVAFEHLSFDSGYEPHPDEPGRERWLSYAPCRTAHAWVLRHGGDGGGRPWLVCIHGYQMGTPLVDFGAFRPAWLHDRLGLNLVMPVLPVHGPRRIRRMSGDGFLSGELLDTVHALAQTAWDVRRIVSWVRAQGAAAVGVYGLSLGGYSTALVSSLEPGFACGIAGIPATDFARLSWKHGPADSLRRAEEAGIGLGETTDLKKVVSPLVLQPKLARERRFVFGGSADQLVPPDHVRDLWRHWERPAIHWYPGAHCTFGLHAPVRRFVEDALRESGLVAAAR